MSNASVTPPMRAYGWNIHLLASDDSFHFAGFFQPHGSDMVSFRDVVAEMQLCFETPHVVGQIIVEGDVWDNLGFSFSGLVNLPIGATQVSAYPSFVSHSDLDQPVPSPPPTFDPRDPPVAQFCVVYHRTGCDLPSSASLALHFRAGCAAHISRPVRRRDPRYLPPKKTSADPRFARLPFRKTIRTRGGSQSPTKRSASGSASPKKDAALDDNDANDDEVTNMVAPPEMDVAVDFARQTVSAFRSSCLVAAGQCAVTGKGRSWCINPGVGPALQACHIVPQQHYHVYPDSGRDMTNFPEYSPRRLREAWQRTWSPKNSILLLSHLHELFDARLFSIHPDSLRVRVFVPYDVILDYHGRTARVPASTDRRALRHHYDMCCIENMGAELPLLDPGVDTGLGSGTGSPLNSIRSKVLVPSNLGMPGSSTQPGDSTEGLQHGRGDPSKRTRATRDDLQDGGHIEDMTLPGTVNTSLRRNSHSESPWAPDAPRTPSHADGSDWEERSRSHKRRKFSRDASGDDNGRVLIGKEDAGDTWGEDSYWEGCVTAENHEAFLSDVNWELMKRV